MQEGFSPTHRALRWAGGLGTVLAPCEVVSKVRRSQHVPYRFVVRFADGAVETKCAEYVMEGAASA